jgi:hypothetical protein
MNNVIALYVKLLISTEMIDHCITSAAIIINTKIKIHRTKPTTISDILILKFDFPNQFIYFSAYFVYIGYH